jgi:hypothetical protein
VRIQLREQEKADAAAAMTIRIMTTTTTTKTTMIQTRVPGNAPTCTAPTRRTFFGNAFALGDDDGDSGMSDDDDPHHVRWQPWFEQLTRGPFGGRTSSAGWRSTPYWMMNGATVWG